MAPIIDRGHVYARSRLDILLSVCVCEVGFSRRPLDTRRPWGRGVREVTGGNRLGAQGPQGRRPLSTDCWFAFDRRCF